MNGNLNDIKVGDKVWCIQRGECIVTSVIPNLDIAPIIVAHKDFPNKNIAYDMDGKLFKTDIAPSLFREKPDCFEQKIEEEK